MHTFLTFLPYFFFKELSSYFAELHFTISGMECKKYEDYNDIRSCVRIRIF